MAHADQAMELPARDDKTLTLVRDIGFDVVYDVCAGKTTERIFFIGPHMRNDDDTERGAHATEGAVREFIGYWKNQIEVAQDYLLNGREARTHLFVEDRASEQVKFTGSPSNT